MSEFADVVRATEAKPGAGGYLARCPAHEDKHASLSIKESDGKWLFKCFTGCSFDSIKAALEARGITFPEREREEKPEPSPLKVYEIRSVDGEVIAQHTRKVLPDGSKDMRWRRPNGEPGLGGIRVVDLPLYGSELLKTPSAVLDAGGPVIVTEGEKAADAVRRLRYLGLGTVTGAAACPSDVVLSVLKDRVVCLWPDNDPQGAAHMGKIGAALKKLGVTFSILTWPDAPPKGDAADFVERGGTAEQLQALIDAAAAKSVAPAKRKLRQLWEGVKEASNDLDNFSQGVFPDRLSTGLLKLDRKLRGGMRGGEETLIGAPTGGGKTSLAQQIAAHAAKYGPVLFVTPEMSIAALAEREIVRRSKTAIWARNPWDRHPNDVALAVNAHIKAAGEIFGERLPLYILDQTDATMLDVEEAAVALGPALKLIVIDYAQQVAGTDDDRPRYLQVGDVGTRSVALATKLNVPIIVASQVNVAEDKKTGAKTFSFRETQILEHKAHNVLIFDVTWGQDGERRFVQEAHIVCTKNRSGETFRLPVFYDPALYRISDRDDRRDDWQPPKAKQASLLTRDSDD